MKMISEILKKKKGFNLLFLKKFYCVSTGDNSVNFTTKFLMPSHLYYVAPYVPFICTTLNLV